MEGNDGHWSSVQFITRARLGMARGENRAVAGRSNDNQQYICDCKSNQGKFYPRFDCVVLLSAPSDVMFDRIMNRTTNNYGKSEEERARILGYLEIVQPMLRASAVLEIDTSVIALKEVVAAMIALGNDDASLQ